ncbi:TolC family protein [Sandarakinorhabdus sp.]|uniref:TolC family protein n=1 Tax=Sandarakinorhabdus sp. TaxID=1916663 RepID=UPI003340D149
MMKIISPSLLVLSLLSTQAWAQAADPSAAPETTRAAVTDRTRADAPMALDEAYELALDYDAEYKLAEAEFDVNKTAAKQSMAAYLPSASYSMTNIPTDGLTRQVFSVNQPIVSLERLAVLRQRGPRRRYADTYLLFRQNELAQRVLKSVADYVRANESAKLNAAKVRALSEQSVRATRLYKGGLGTVTDARELEVRYQQAKAAQILLESERGAVAARLRSLTGVDISDKDFILPDRVPRIALLPKEELEPGVQTNPSVIAAGLSERVAKLDAQRAKWGLLPTVNGSASYTLASGRSISFVGITVSAPINAGGIFSAQASSASARRSSEERRRIQEQAKVGFQRLYGLVSGGDAALQSSALAIEAAEQSVVANQKSYDGGVRSNLDVVNAIQTAFEVKSQYVNSAMSLAENYLDLQLTAGVSAAEAIASVQKFMFRGQR